MSVLHSPMTWIGLFVVVASAGATVLVGMEMYGYTAAPMIFNNR